MNHNAEVLHIEVRRGVSSFNDEVFHASFTPFMDDSSSVRILQLFQYYLGSLGSKNGHPLADYINMVEVMLV